VFIAILSGARVGGLLGVIVAVPAAVIIKQALVALRNGRQEEVSGEVDPSTGSNPVPVEATASP
jgi:predicted PurR-regulated permease PerM